VKKSNVARFYDYLNKISDLTEIIFDLNQNNQGVLSFQSGMSFGEKRL